MPQPKGKPNVRVAMTSETQELLSLLRELTGYSLHQLIHELAIMGASVFIARWGLVKQAHHDSARRLTRAQRRLSPSERKARAHGKLRGAPWLYHFVSSPSFAVAFAERSTHERGFGRSETTDYLNRLHFKTADGKKFAKSTTDRLFHPKKQPLPKISATELVLALGAARLQRTLSKGEQRTIATAWNRAKKEPSDCFRPVRKAIDLLWRPVA